MGWKTKLGCATVTTWALGHMACSRAPIAIQQLESARAVPIARYDLIPRGYDRNGFSFNPEWGYRFNLAHKNDPSCPNGDKQSNPSTCSWRFNFDRRITIPPCNNLLVDPDFSDNWSTSVLGITCSDSPLLYTGHINWGESYGGAVSYEGFLDWEEWAPDNDYNFLLQTDDDKALAPGVAIGVEINESEIRNFNSQWFRQLRESIVDGADATKNVVDGTEVVVTGLLGIDAEHMSSRDLNVELHPVYSMAIHAGSPIADSDVWTLLVRDQGDEGFCSHRSRPHVLKWPGQRYEIELPIKCMGGVSRAELSFCNHGKGATEVSLTIDSRRSVALASMTMEQGSIVEGEIRFRCAEHQTRTKGKKRLPDTMGTSERPAGAGPLDRRFRRPRGDDRGPQLQQQLEHLCIKDPAECTRYKDAVRGSNPPGACQPVATSEPTFANFEPVKAKPIECADGLPSPFDPQKKSILTATLATSTSKATETKALPPRKELSPHSEYCAERSKQNHTAAEICSFLQQAQQ
jgi:hypothetical protein